MGKFELFPVGWPHYVIADDSMSPALRIGDVVYVDESHLPLQKLEGLIVQARDANHFFRLKIDGEYALLEKDNDPNHPWRVPAFRVAEVVVGRVVLVRREVGTET